MKYDVNKISAYSLLREYIATATIYDGSMTLKDSYNVYTNHECKLATNPMR